LPALSTGGRNDLCELLQWCHIAKSRAWSSVEAALNAFEISGRVLSEVGADAQCRIIASDLARDLPLTKTLPVKSERE
jgi:hypothetical protein